MDIGITKVTKLVVNSMLNASQEVRRKLGPQRLLPWQQDICGGISPFQFVVIRRFFFQNWALFDGG